MFAYIKGVLEEKNENYVVIDVGGIGYKVFMPTNSIQQLPERGENVKVHTYYYVREDNISLFGFTTLEELKMFELLLSVSGIGTKSALATLSEITPSAFALSIITGDVSTLVKIPGVGNKTAQRMILELKDKLKTENAVAKPKTGELVGNSQTGQALEEASSALLVLGYTKKEIDQVLRDSQLASLSVEDMIKEALKRLSK